MDVIPQGWFGFTADGFNEPWMDPAGAWVRYFEYPTVVGVDANSPASRAGMSVGDLLLAYDGLDLRRNPINLSRLLMPGREVVVKLRRDGASKDLVIAVEKAPASVMDERRTAAAATMIATPARGLMIDSMERRLVENRVAVAAAGRATSGAIGPTTRAAPAAVRKGVAGTISVSVAPGVTGIFGAEMAAVDADLAQSIAGLGNRRGVFVERVRPGSLAERMGFKRGDVILAVESDDVANTSELRTLLQYQSDIKHREKILLRILRGGKTQDLTIDGR
jgi:S1-C subfamily serine protease